MKLNITTMIPLEFTFWYKVTFSLWSGWTPAHLLTHFPRELTEKIRKKEKKKRKIHGPRKRQLNTWAKKPLKPTHHSYKQTCAQTTSEQCLLWNFPPFVTPSPILFPGMDIMVQKSSFVLCRLPWICPCLNFYPPLNKWLKKFCYFKHRWRQSLDFQLGVNFE